jgi:hypothetical protein
MKNLNLMYILLLISIIFSGCAIVGGIFKAGVGVGVFIVILIFALIAWVISKSSNNKS